MISVLVRARSVVESTSEYVTGFVTVLWMLGKENAVRFGERMYKVELEIVLICNGVLTTAIVKEFVANVELS